MWSTTYVLFALYVLWALLPDAWIRRAGVAWYPNRCVRVFAREACPSALRYMRVVRGARPRERGAWMDGKRWGWKELVC